MNVFRFAAILIVLLVLAYGAAAQTEVCISQEAANKCAELARTDKAKDEKIVALETALAQSRKNEQDLIATNRQNVADLTDRLHKTELALATKTGEIIGCQAQNVEQRAIIAVILPMVKKKRNAFITIF